MDEILNMPFGDGSEIHMLFQHSMASYRPFLKALKAEGIEKSSFVQEVYNSLIHHCLTADGIANIVITKSYNFLQQKGGEEKFSQIKTFIKLLINHVTIHWNSYRSGRYIGKWEIADKDFQIKLQNYLEDYFSKRISWKAGKLIINQFSIETFHY